MDFEKAAQSMGSDVYQRFKSAIETGRWPDGSSVSEEQKQTCMQAIILYEQKHVAADQRTGFVTPKPSACASDKPNDTDESTLKWKDE